MVRTKSLRFINFGPPIATVPVNHFSKFRFSHEMEEGLWQIIGPSVARNVEACGWQMWKVIVCAYAEGLHHGSQLQLGLEAEQSGPPGPALPEVASPSEPEPPPQLKVWEC